jgi:hypothetical protein
MLAEVSAHCSEVFLRTAISQSIVGSALEIPKDGTAALFLQEAAHTALRSVANKYGFTLRQEILFKGLTKEKPNV